jgi:hypothetical protein
VEFKSVSPHDSSYSFTTHQLILLTLNKPKTIFIILKCRVDCRVMAKEQIVPKIAPGSLGIITL